METSDGAEALELESGRPRRRLNPQTPLLIIAVVLLIIVLLAVRDVAARVDHEVPHEGITAADGRQLLGPAANDDNDFAVRLVAGLPRRTDDLTFGEYVKERYRGECSVDRAAPLLLWRLWTDGDTAYHVVLSVESPGQTADGAPCSSDVYVADVRWQDGELLKPSRSRGASGTNAIVVDWLADFESGHRVGEPDTTPFRGSARIHNDRP